MTRIYGCDGCLPSLVFLLTFTCSGLQVQATLFSDGRARDGFRLQTLVLSVDDAHGGWSRGRTGNGGKRDITRMLRAWMDCSRRAVQFAELCASFLRLGSGSGNGRSGSIPALTLSRCESKAKGPGYWVDACVGAGCSHVG